MMGARKEEDAHRHGFPEGPALALCLLELLLRLCARTKTRRLRRVPEPVLLPHEFLVHGVGLDAPGVLGLPQLRLVRRVALDPRLDSLLVPERVDRGECFAWLGLAHAGVRAVDGDLVGGAALVREGGGSGRQGDDDGGGARAGDGWRGPRRLLTAHEECVLMRAQLRTGVVVGCGGGHARAVQGLGGAGEGGAAQARQRHAWLTQGGAGTSGVGIEGGMGKGAGRRGVGLHRPRLEGTPSARVSRRACIEWLKSAGAAVDARRGRQCSSVCRSRG